MSGISTHVLDTARGRPAVGVPVCLQTPEGQLVGRGSTNADGRVAELSTGTLQVGSYQLVFDTAVYFAATGQQGFYPEISVTFAVTDPQRHYHVPLLLSPFAYSTYRGS